MKKYLVFDVLAVAVLVLLFAMPLSAAENVKIKLPDGVYMYDSSVQRLKDGSDRVGFGKFFVVYDKNIYSSKEFAKIFGISKLDTLFGGDKKYKILCSGEVIGTKYNLRFEKDVAMDRENATFGCDESYNTKNIKEGPAYGRESIYLGRLGSSVKCIAVPEEYKEIKKKVYIAIPQEEVDKISKLVKDKLFDLVKNRKELAQYKLKNIELDNEKLELLDKISTRNDEMYMGIYRYVFKNAKGVIHEFEIVFNASKDNVYVITSQYDAATLSDGGMKIQSMLDVDGCGEEELIILKGYGGLGEAITNIEIYKQKADGNWSLIKKISWRDEV